MRSFYVAEQAVIQGGVAGNAHLVAAGGEIDYASCPKLRALLAEATRLDDAPLIVDLSNATFIDSTAIGVLAHAASRLGELNRAMAIVCANPRILRILQMVGLDELLAVHDTVEQAVSALAGQVAS